MTDDQQKTLVEGIKEEILRAQHLAETSNKQSYWLGVFAANERMLVRLSDRGINVDEIIESMHL